MTEKNRGVITGLGPVSAIGVGLEEFWEGISIGDYPIDDVSSFNFDSDSDRPKSTKAAEIIDFDVNDFLESKKGYLDRNSQLAFAAAKLTLDDSGIETTQENAARVGISFGTGYGNLGTLFTFYENLATKGPKLVPPILFPHTYANTTISLLSIEYNIKGYNCNLCSGLAAGGSAIAYALDVIRDGRADAMLCGGAESFSEPLFKGFSSLGQLATASDGVDEASRPFDKKRNGFILGEGVGMIAIESAGSASARGARIYAELAGAGLANDIESAMRLALTDAELERSDIDVIVAAADSSLQIDAAEAGAIRNLFGERAIPVAAIKSMIGETCAAFGGLGVIAAVLSIQNSLIPPTVNLEDMDDDCTLAGLSDEPREAEVKAALVNAIDLGGSCVSLVVKSA